MLCERSGMNEIVDRMSIVYFRSDCGFHNYPYMVRGRTFLNSFSAKIWRKWSQISPNTLILNTVTSIEDWVFIYYIYLFKLLIYLHFLYDLYADRVVLLDTPIDLDEFHWFRGRPNRRIYYYARWMVTIIYEWNVQSYALYLQQWKRYPSATFIIW